MNRSPIFDASSCQSSNPNRRPSDIDTQDIFRHTLFSANNRSSSHLNPQDIFSHTILPSSHAIPDGKIDRRGNGPSSELTSPAKPLFDLHGALCLALEIANEDTLKASPRAA